VDQKSVVARTRASRTTCHSWCWGHRKLVDESLRCWKTEGKRWWKLCRILQIDMIETGKKNMSDFMIETMLKKLQCFSSFFRIKLWLKNYGIIPLRSRPKMLMGRPWKDTAFFHDGFVMDTAVITWKLWLKYLKLYFFFYQLSHKITWILVLFCPIIWKCL
jgi:hypothetical protein